MNKDERLKSMEALEKERGSRVITYLTADRGVASTQITEEVLRIIYDHLRAIGKVKKLDVLLYSRGGDTMLPWPLVTTIRAFCDHFSVLVPFKAHSAATLIGLGADEIVMTPLAQLTPIEPTIKMLFSPGDPANPGQKLGINVEDVATYFEFVKERGGITDDQGRSAALTALTGQVHPVALGNLHRFHQLARMQAEKLLLLHMDDEKEREEVSNIVENLVARLWAHEYRIGREEARSLGLKIADPSEGQEAALWALFEGYEDAMELRRPLSPATAFPVGQATVTPTDVKLAYVESREQTDVFLADFQLSRTPIATPPGQPQHFGPQVQISVTRQEWTKE